MTVHFTTSQCYSTIVRAALLLGLLLYSSEAFTQNLILNPDFEDRLFCPKALGTFDQDVEAWTCPTEGSTDYFHRCSEVMGVPKNYNGRQEAYSGDAYAGLYFFAPGDYREYLQAELVQTLEAGRKYHFEVYISLAESADFAVRKFGLMFSEQRIQIATSKYLSKGRLLEQQGNRIHTLEMEMPEISENREKWYKLKLSFTAKGFERYLLLGNFYPNKGTQRVKTERWGTKQGAYYYVDKTGLYEDGNSLPDYQLERRYTFPKVYFAFDSDELDRPAKESLKEMKAFLKKNKSYYIIISGHTDSLGQNAYNSDLSHRRAQSIANHLIRLGIDKERIGLQSFGSQKPLAANHNEKGRQKNRRAEFKLSLVEPLPQR